ncbi:MAG: 50S ribosomal protein L4 [Candidatus Gottesmanbacteria bacterium]
MPKTKKTIVKETDEVKNALTADIFDMDGKVVGKIELSKDIFDTKINQTLLAQSVRVYLANQRQGSASTKTRGEVAGSTKKVYRQKGTGRARHGSIKAPIYVGGGIVFGPKPRDFSLKMPSAMKKKALFSALTAKYKNNDIQIIEDLEKPNYKTKEIIKMFQALNSENKNNLNIKTLIISTLKNNLNRACRNIANLTLMPVELINPYQVLSHQKIIFTKKAIANLH